jgi:hypothetical protein
MDRTQHLFSKANPLATSQSIISLSLIFQKPISLPAIPLTMGKYRMLPGEELIPGAFVLNRSGNFGSGAIGVCEEIPGNAHAARFSILP